MSMFAWGSAAPVAWEVLEPDVAGQDRLRLGARIVRLADVVDFKATSTTELNIDGHLAAVGLFLAAGAVFLVPVAMSIAHPRFMAGAVLFFGIGIMILVDIAQGHRNVMHRVEIRLADGSQTRFASVDPAICQGLAQALASHRGG